MSEIQNQASEVEATFDNTVDKVDVKFNFRKVAIEVDGKPTGEFTKRPTVELSLPLLSVEGVVAALKAGGKQLDLVVEAVRAYQLDRARDLVNDNESVTQDNFPFAQLSWESIANLPKAERRGGGISKETWEDFSKDYVAVMPGATGKTVEQVTNAAKILTNKFQAVKNSKPHLKLLKDQLAIYASASANAEQFSDCLSFLVEKADALLALDEAAMLGNL